MNNRIFIVVAFMWILSPFRSPATAANGEDHPLISKYEGSTIQSNEVEQFGEYKLITSRTKAGEFESQTLKGKVTRIVYENPRSRSTLEIYDNYKKALAAAGVQTIYSCVVDGCGPAYARSAWGRFNGLFVTTDGDPRYFAGKLEKEGKTAYVALMVGRKRTQLDVVDIIGMEENLVSIDAAALANGLDKEGRISVYGIFFDTDKSEIKPESKPALDEIAKLLTQRPALKLFVVGHTDMTGGFDHNQILSESRAKSVVKTLISAYGIDPARLEGHGVGPLAPVASNDNESGKAKNRRVELVAR